MMKQFNLNKISGINSIALYVGTVLIFVVFTVLCNLKGINFLSTLNVSNIIVQSTIIAIIAIGQSIVIISGGIDLSVGSVAGFSAMFTGVLIMNFGFPVPAAIVTCLIGGLLLGMVNGLIISVSKVPAFIMTLGMMSIARGGALAINGGQPVTNMPASLGKLALDIHGVPRFIIYVIVLYTIMIIIMNKTVFGRHIYAVGGNEKAARLSGINVTRVQVSAYMIGGLFAAMGGVLLLARLMYGSPTGGSGYELTAIAAAIIGGIAMSGGSGRLFNTFIGAIIMGSLNTGLQILNVPVYFQQIIIGTVIVLAVFFDKKAERKAE